MDTDVLWKKVLDEAQVLVSKAFFGSFFATSKILGVENSIVTIGCNTPMSVNMLETRYYALIKNLLDKHAQFNCSVLFKVLPVTTSTKEAGPLFSHLSPEVNVQQAIKISRLRTDFTFDTFAVSNTNHMAYAAAVAVAESPGTSYNPLFFYGGVGVGKTHLMQAIGNVVLQKMSGKKVIYCMGEEFTNEIVDAIQTKSTKRFKDKYRSANILLIDDVQFLEGKIKVQEEFFHTFNAVQREGGQIVLTSDRPPHEIDRLEERLLSRFEAGLLVDVQNPDFELRCAILRIKAQQKGVDLEIKIAQILAAQTDSVRKLEGLLTRLLTESQFKKLPISEELAYAVVGKPAEPSTKAVASTPKQVAEAIMRRFGVTLAQLKSPIRSRSIARPRQVLMFVLRTELSLSLEEVGDWVGGRDHTTVMHAVETISTLLSTNPKTREDVEWVKKEAIG